MSNLKVIEDFAINLEDEDTSAPLTIEVLIQILQESLEQGLCEPDDLIVGKLNMKYYLVGGVRKAILSSIDEKEKDTLMFLTFSEEVILR